MGSAPSAESRPVDIDRGIEDLQDGTYVEVDEEGLETFLDNIKRKALEKIDRESSPESDGPAD